MRLNLALSFGSCSFEEPIQEMRELTCYETDLDDTHSPGARSFVESANAEGCDFPLQNLPFGAFTNGQNAGARLCVAIGDQVLDLAAAAELDLLEDLDESFCEVCQESSSELLLGLGPAHWTSCAARCFA